MTNSEMIEKLKYLAVTACGITQSFGKDYDMSQDIESLTHAIELLKAEGDGLLLELPCKVGDGVFVIADCVNVLKDCEDDYLTGTGAITCPFEISCEFEKCDDSHRRIFNTYVRGIWIDEDGLVNYFFEHIIDRQFYHSDFGKTVFLTKEEAEKSLKENKNEQ